MGLGVPDVRNACPGSVSQETCQDQGGHGSWGGGKSAWSQQCCALGGLGGRRADTEGLPCALGRGQGELASDVLLPR